MNEKMPHELIRFWKGAYGKYEFTDKKLSSFSIPGFADPLLSANFPLTENFPAEHDLGSSLNSFSWIASLGEENKQLAGWNETRSFYLGVASTKDRPGKMKKGISILPTERAIATQDFWKVLKEVHGEDLPFLEKFLPFACRQEARFFTLFAYIGKKPLGLLNIGFAGGVGLALSAAVVEKHRHEGVGAELFEAARSLARQEGIREIVFWTKHPQLLTQASRSYRYSVYERAQAKLAEAMA